MREVEALLPSLVSSLALLVSLLSLIWLLSLNRCLLSMPLVSYLLMP